jgi:uncharacterized protein (TIGR02996 family)
MSRLEGFLASIAQNPRDDDLWLILADWLDEQGDPRSELVRLQHALRQQGSALECAAKEERLRTLLAAGVRPLVPRLTNSLGLEMVRLSAGAFWMGGGGGKAGDKQVEIPHVFCIGVYPVTQDEWQALMGNNPSWFSRTGGGAAKVQGIPDDDLQLFPVEQVSWEDAQEFLKRLNAREKEGDWVYRLPTEAEWEYACRGGPVSQEECSYHFYLDKPSNSLCSTHANFDGNYPDGEVAKGPYTQRTSKVGSYRPNRLSIFDMHGNVWEWCDDWYDAWASYRVVRGGGWDHYASYVRAAHRLGFRPSFRNYALGMRLVRVPVGTQGK